MKILSKRGRDKIASSFYLGPPPGRQLELPFHHDATIRAWLDWIRTQNVLHCLQRMGCTLLHVPLQRLWVVEFGDSIIMSFTDEALESANSQITQTCQTIIELRKAQKGN